MGFVHCAHHFFERYDEEIDPGPEPDAHEIAERVVAAMRWAYKTGKPQNIMLHTIRLGADLWRQYVIRFDPQAGEVAVRIGPIVNTGQIPLLGSEPQGAEEVWVEVGVPMVHTYDAENKIDIFSGPSFKFVRKGDKLHVHFLDWHRRWSHSLTLAAAFGVMAGLLFGKWAGMVAGLGFAGHVLEDQLGFMGSNLLYPFTRGRVTGLQLLRSGDAVPNFLTVWTAVALIIFNLDHFSAQPLLNPWWFLRLAVVVLGGLYQWQRRRGKPEAKESLQQRDIVSEAEEVEVR